jgi:hypothetical protein
MLLAAIYQTRSESSTNLSMSKVEQVVLFIEILTVLYSVLKIQNYIIYHGWVPLANYKALLKYICHTPPVTSFYKVHGSLNKCFSRYTNDIGRAIKVRVKLLQCWKDNNIIQTQPLRPRKLHLTNWFKVEPSQTLMRKEDNLLMTRPENLSV